MNVVLLGAPGAGKGTQARRLQDRYHLAHVSTGDLLRSEIGRGTPLGLEVQSTIDEGGLVSDDIMIRLIEAALKEKPAPVVLDGFPRNVAQAKSLDALFMSLGRQVDHVILIDVEAEELIRRLSGRIMCKKCLTGYHMTLKPTKVPGVCDVCQGTEFVRRKDDSVDTIRSRLAIFSQETNPILAHYDAKNILYRVNGMLEIDGVTKQIERILGFASERTRSV